MNSDPMNVAILGASNDPERYAHKAQQMLMDHGHATFPISLSGEAVLDQPGYRSILDIPREAHPIHTVTVYLNPQRFAGIVDDVIEAAPTRIILNPGTESPEIAEKFRAAGIRVVEACTLVLLATGQFDAA